MFCIEVKRWITPLCQWILLIFGFFKVTSSINCPGVCFCPPVTKYVHCSRKNLPFIPSGISDDTTHLFLNENNFLNTNLSRSNFTYLTSLERLYLISCGIEFISVDTFVDLKRLKWLDISKNRLKVIYDDTFRGLRLNYLFLNNNKGVRLSKHAFRGLQAMGLYIHECSIVNISIEHIRPLNGSLKSLWLDGNKLEYFQEEWQYLFNTLGNLRIGDNPLHCNCEVQWLYKFYESHSTMFSGVDPPSCRTPPRLRGKKFNSLVAEDFRCQLPIFKNVDVIFEKSVGKMTCSAIGDPIPTIIWEKPDKSVQVYKHKELDSLGGAENEGVLYLTDPQSIDNAKFRCIAQNPAGNVTFSLNVIWGTPFSRQKDPAVLDTPSTQEVPYHSKGLNPLHPQKEDSGNSTKKVGEKKQYVINASSQSSGISVSKNQETTEMTFTMVDIVGAVVGTFLLTLLACIIIVHLFHRHQERVLYRNQNGVNETSVTTRHVVTEGRNENVKMLQNNHHV